MTIFPALLVSKLNHFIFFLPFIETHPPRFVYDVAVWLVPAHTDTRLADGHALLFAFVLVERLASVG